MVCLYLTEVDNHFSKLHYLGTINFKQYGNLISHVSNGPTQLNIQSIDYGPTQLNIQSIDYGPTQLNIQSIDYGPTQLNIQSIDIGYLMI
jgi:hypothetical protein